MGDGSPPRSGAEELYNLTILDSAGRKAFRSLKNKARVNEYKYHFVRGKPSETADDAPPSEPQPPA